MTPLTDLPDIGRRIAAQLDSHFDPAQARTRQVLALVEEAGEFADAYVGEDTEATAAELADVMITAHVTAAVFGVELPDLPLAGGDPGGPADRYVVAVTAAACAVAGAYRRAAGMARRAGPAEDVVTHLGEVTVAAWDAAKKLRVDLGAAVASKVDVLYVRGWRDPRPDAVELVTVEPGVYELGDDGPTAGPPQSRPRGAVSPGDPDWVAGFGPVPGSGLGGL